MPYAIRLNKQHKIDITDYDPSDTHGIDEPTALAETKKLGAELGDLQELLYAASMQSVLIVLQGMDTSGKDGTISHVFADVNPQGVDVASFKQPTPEELAHDFLWRAHAKTPQKGYMTIFNRSHYEDVLAVRVHNLVPEDVWKRRYEQINHFERMLAASDTIVLKFFLHISKSEQKERLLAREKDPRKGWKISAGDWKEREFWNDYVKAYDAVLSKTATDDAPWYIVPANHKWFRNLAIADTLVHALRPHRAGWDDRLQEIGQRAVADLQKMREKSLPQSGNASTISDD